MRKDQQKSFPVTSIKLFSRLHNNRSHFSKIQHTSLTSQKKKNKASVRSDNRFNRHSELIDKYTPTPHSKALTGESK